MTLSALVIAVLLALLATACRPPHRSEAGLSDDAQARERAVVPFVAEGGDRCAATLIAPTVLLTAAHCLPEPARAARVLFETAGGVVQSVAVARATPDPAFDRQSLANDLAVLILSSPAPVPPLRLASFPLEPSILLRPVRIVSFASASGTSARRRSLTATAERLRESDVLIEQARPPFCRGSSGGAVLVADGESEALAGIISGGDSRCEEYIRAQRIDTRLADFVGPYLASPSDRRESSFKAAAWFALVALLALMGGAAALALRSRRGPKAPGPA